MQANAIPRVSAPNPKLQKHMKTHLPNHHSRSAGLTLIELLVVIAVIVLLVGLSMPIFTTPTCVKGRITDSLSNGKQVALALIMYAEDHDGRFPSTRADGKPCEAGDFSNQAFEQLMPKYSSSKLIFRNKASAWCKSPPVDAELGDAIRLNRGQNDWNYVAGLTQESKKDWPLIATATKSATDLTYTNSKKARGGVWEGRDAIVAYVDGSARPLSGKEMDCTDKTRTFPKRPDNGANIFIGTPDWLGTGRLILAPE